ncbi:replication/maintenance protein RepL [Winogradskyella schleiferi]|uniref:replication/maintenance protein RepL n=1 Tax=Winogradskyella schleiferi TaxID=2686078 RepID=UPI0015BC963B|nr:replication/maintenance protein RepL [Winogradskyella schleiferi]
MAIIQYSTAFNALEGYVNQHNASTKDLSSHVRQAMILTTQEIIKIYSISLLKANSIAAIDLQNLPPLKTNNVQLAKRAKASTRTIQRHLKRLIEANIITKKIWHGSNSGYELFINPNILLIGGVKAVNKPENELQTEKSKTTDNQFFKNSKTTTCPHTDTSNNGYINNIIIGVDKLKTKASSLPLTKGYESRNATSNTFTGYTGKIDPKKNNDAGEIERKSRATDQTGAEISGVDQARSASLSFYVKSFWKLARNTIYKDHYLTQSQEKTALKLLHLWYEPVSDKQLQNVHEVYVSRLGIVQKYIAKDPTKRYVQLPDKYFDPKNPSGFTGTRIWYQKQKKREYEVRLKLILQAQIRRFLNNEKKETAKQKPRLELFRSCETRISKLGQPELLNTFHASVLNHSTHKYLQLNT